MYSKCDARITSYEILDEDEDEDMRRRKSIGDEDISKYPLDVLKPFLHHRNEGYKTQKEKNYLKETKKIQKINK